eukprot:79989-Chlamydomonas_euryale.AAC.2
MATAKAAGPQPSKRAPAAGKPAPTAALPQPCLDSDPLQPLDFDDLQRMFLDEDVGGVDGADVNEPLFGRSDTSAGSGSEGSATVWPNRSCSRTRTQVRGGLAGLMLCGGKGVLRGHFGRKAKPQLQQELHASEGEGPPSQVL